MNDGIAKLILNSFESHRSSIPQRGRAWRWAEGVILFPEALCPGCNGVMRSPRIWWVDDHSQRLILAARFDGAKLVRVTNEVHPHVDGYAGGHVCCGDAKSATEALFLGLGMGSPYWSPGADWYKQAFDHVCTGSRRNSRNHLTQSMEIARKRDAKQAAGEIPPAAEPIITATSRVTVEEAERAMAAARIQQLRAGVLRRQQARPPSERPMFDGSMAGNSEATGISADDQPGGLHVDRL